MGEGVQVGRRVRVGVCEGTRLGVNVNVGVNVCVGMDVCEGVAEAVEVGV